MSAFLRACLFVTFFLTCQARIPSGLLGSASTQEVLFNLKSDKHLDHSELPEQLRYGNLTQENLDKWFAFTPMIELIPANSSAAAVQVPLHEVAAAAARSGGIANVVNIAKTIWDIVKDDAATVNINGGDYATATPSGYSWSQLSGWNTYNWKGWRLAWTNIYGATTCDIQWNFVWACKGNVNGKGQFLTQASQQVLVATSLWGYTLDVTGTASQPLNVGTSSNPVGRITLAVNAKCSSVLKDQVIAKRVNVDGACRSSS